MQSTIVRPVLCSVSRPVGAPRMSKLTLRRSFADSAPGDVTKGDSTRSVPPNPASGNSRLPFIIGGGLLFAVVAGRYIIASDKPAASGFKEQQEARRSPDSGKEYRDPRDSPVKTLEQKKQKEQSS